MKRFIQKFVVTALCVLSVVQGFSGEVIVGTGTTRAVTLPYNNNWKYATTQSIYTASEIGVAAKITSIAYEVAASSSMTNQSVKIYMAHTSKSSFSSVADALSEDELTEVYSGTITLGSKTGWESIKLATPFVYNGSDNLVVAVTRAVPTGATYNSVLKYNYTDCSSYMSLYRRSDSNVSYADISSDVTYAATSTTRPNIKFGFTYSLPVTDGYYLINTVTDLETFRNSVSNGGLNFVNARLMNNLTLNERVLDANGRLRADYETVGLKTIPALNYGSSAYYLGVFDGNNHTISGIYCKATYYVGLFAGLGTGAIVKDLKIRDSYFEAQADVAAITGYCPLNATIRNCSVEAHIYASASSAGGIVGGYFRNGTIDGCENLGIVESNGSQVGGIVGYADASKGIVVNCSNTGTIIGSSSVGGIVGEGYCGVTNCNNTGTVSANVSNAGGIVGHIQGTLANALTGNYNTGRVESVTNVGGIIGLTDYKTSVEQCYNAGPISGTDYIGGLIGKSTSISIVNAYNTGSVAATEGFVGGLVGSTSSSITVATSYNAGVVTNNGQTAYTGALCGNIFTGTFTNCYYLEQGIGAVNNAAQSGCTVKTKENLKLISNLSGFSTDYWKNTTSSGAVTISNDGEFRNDRSGYYVSLKNVGTAQPCTISYYNFGTTDSPDWQTYTPIYTYDDLANMALTGRYVLMNDLRKSDGSSVAWNPIGTELAPFTGTLIGRGKTIAFLTNTTAKYNGILGYTNGATIKNVTIAKSTFTGAQYVGAIVAYATNTLISGCTIDTCTIQSSKIAGGLCGYARADVRILDCRNYGGSVSSSEQGGGIIGYCISSVGQIERCLNTAMITANIAGGIIGKGIYDSNRVKIRELVNYGSITASTAAGGVVGEVSALGYVYDCINYGNVNNPSSGSAGGIIGEESGGDYAFYCINIGTITGKGVVGAICGASGSFYTTHCYYNKDISGAKEVAGTDKNNYAPKSTVELGSGELPSSNFDTDIWGTRLPEIKDDGFKYKYYPYLKWLGEEYIEIAQKLQCFPVTMNYIGGTADEDLTFYVETEGATLPSDVTQLGFTFGGWYSNSNYAGSPIAEITVDETGPKTYYAKWSVNNYSVTLNTDGGIINRGNIASYNYGFSGTLPTDVTKTGYTFAGWYEVPRADLVLSATNITGNISNALLIEKALVNASGNGVEYWREKILSLVNNIETEIVVAANADATTLNKYLKELAKTSAVYSIDYDIDALPKTGCDLILESYNESALSATVAAIRGINGCSLVEARDLVLNSPSTIIDNVSLEDIMAYKAQLEAVGATVSYINYDEVESLVSTDYGDRCYKAKWNVNTYNVVLEANGGKNENVINEYTYGIGATLPDDSEITRTGYTFGGWYLNSSFTGDMFTEISGSDYGDKIYYAKWTAKEYDVSFNANNGVINGGDFDSYTFGTYNLLPTDVTRTGYTFGGWYEVKEGEAAGASVTDVYLESAGAQKLLVVKLVKEYLGLGLKEAKDLVDSAPSTLVTQMDREAADRFLAALIEAGASASLKNALGGVATRAIAITDYGNKEFEAKWLVNTYTVTLQANGGTINSGNVTEYVYGALKSLPTNVTREGYTFAGWYTTSSLDGNRYFAITATETGNKTFYAKWNVNSYAVTLDTDGGSINSGNLSSYTYGVGAILPTDVTKTGFTFTGWIDDDTDAVATNIANNSIGDKSYTASWSQIDYTITYNANGGTSISNDTYNYEDEVTLPNPTRTGYTFLGWYNNSNLVGTPIEEITSTEFGNKEFWAKWEANIYTVTLDANEGEINSGNVTSYTYDVLTILPSDVTRVGYTFLGWYDADDNKVTQISKGTTGAVAYTAKWSAKTYTITLQTNSGTINAGNVTSYTYGVGATLPTNVTKNGYEFVGWFDNSSYEGGSVTTISKTDLGNKNYWAKWRNASYAVTLNVDGGTINANNVTSYTYGAGVVLPTDVTKTGYTFVSWKDKGGKDAASISATDFGDKTFTASWTLATYTIAYDANGGAINVTYNKNYKLGTSVTLPTNVTKTGCTFAGWYDNANLTGSKITSIANTETGDKTFYAEWTPNKYSVTLDPKDGSINSGNISEYTYGVVSVLPTDVTRQGYVFMGWYADKDCLGDVVSIIASTEKDAKTYYAKWATDSYSVVLNTNNGVIASGNVTGYTYGVGAKLPTAEQITKTGNTFAGWYDNSSCEGDVQTEIPTDATGNRNYWAKWSLNSYDISLNTNGGAITSGNVVFYTFGSGATLPSDVAKAGYTFAGWYKNEDLSGERIGRIDETTTGSQTFYAKWTENTYNIVLVVNEGKINDESYATEYVYGKGAALPTDVTRTGYTFGGWYANSNYDGSAVVSVANNEYGDKTYYAKWSVNAYDVTLYPMDGEIINGNITRYTFGVGATLPTDVVKTGYRLEGWYDNDEFAREPFSVISTDATGDLEFYAKWKVNTYTVELNATGGVINSGEITEYEYKRGAVLPTDVTRNGYQFAGWYNNSNLTGERYVEISTTDLGNKSFFAKWDVEMFSVVLNANGGTVNSGNVTSYTYSNGTILPNNVTKTGCTFVGWYDNEDLEGEIITSVPFDAYGDKEYWAKWTENEYKIVLIVNDGTINEGNVDSYVYGVGAALPIDVTRAGNTFLGWYINSNFDGASVSSITGNEYGDKTYYAKWQAGTFDVTLNTNGGTINSGNVTSYTFGVAAVLPSNVTKTGYEFVGWYDNADLEGDVVRLIANNESGNKEYFANWHVESFDIALNANGGTINETACNEYEYGTAVSLPTDVTKAGYTFAGWYDNPNLVGKRILATDTADLGDKMYFAKWDVMTFNVVLNTNDGDINSGNVVAYTYSNGAVLPINVTKAGYTFAGWYDNEGLEGDGELSIPLDAYGDKEYWAKWTPNPCKISYVVGEGRINGGYVEDYLCGERVVLPTDVTRKGYSFVGWYSNSNYDGAPVEVISENDYGNKVFWAEWKVQSYRVNAEYDRTMGVVDGADFYDYNTAAVLSAKAFGGYEFVEWTTEDEEFLSVMGEGALNDSTIQFNVMQEVKLNAVFKKKEFVYSKMDLVIDTLKIDMENPEIDLTEMFASSEGSAITYDVSSSRPNVVLAQEKEGKLFLSTLGVTGKSDITVTAKLSNGEKTSLTATAVVVYNCDIQAEVSITDAKCFGFSNGSIAITAQEGYQYQWLNTEVFGASLENIPAGNYTVLISDEKGCESYKTYTVHQPAEIIVAVDTVITPRCDRESEIRLSVNGEYEYQWSNGSTAKDLIGSGVGEYTVWVTDPSTGCRDSLTQVISLSFTEPEISLVTVSRETGKNLVVWMRENTDQIDYYTVYRESEEADLYEPIATVSYSELSVYEDEEVDPMERSWSYKVSATDFCGNETELSESHTTLHLSQMPSQREGYVELIWEEYRGISYSSFYIMRETTVGGYTFIDTVTTVPSSIKSYTAEVPSVGKSTYYVGIKLPTVINPKDFLKAESGPFSLAMSNIAEAENDEEPNAVDDLTDAVAVYAVNHTINVKNAGENSITIYDNNGRIITRHSAVSNMPILSFDIRLDGVYIVAVGNQTFMVVVK
ncbi:MAG: ribosomal protein L7/L12 [Bacteroidales bacterium]|nr:ribosomal protein L7/L12 [Bacteroidales bacterium]